MSKNPPDSSLYANLESMRMLAALARARELVG
jgi:hypothetical protein